MDNNNTPDKGGRKESVFWPVTLNAIIIVIVAILGIWIVYFSLAIFTKHGRKDIVPSVENMSYTDAIEKLHDHGFKIEIRDSLYRDDVRPGFVIEQFPKAKSVVKPGRKVFLYINAVNPKEVVVDDGGMSGDALRGYSLRQGISHLQELGFKNIKIVKVLGDNDCIVKVIANGRTVRKRQRVPVNAKIIVEVYDGRLSTLRDSLLNEEMSRSNRTYFQSTEYDRSTDSYSSPSSYTAPQPTFVEPKEKAEPSRTEDQDPTFIE